LARVRKLERLEKMEAETQSNIGKAVKGEDGPWHPLMNEALYGATDFNEFEV